MESERICGLCGRTVSHLTRHHLIPRTRHKNKRNQREFTREEVRTRILMLCRPCHKNTHAQLTEKQLEREYNTVELLLAHPEISKFTEWIRTKRDGFHVQVRANKNKR